jgi:hypothetical protein
VRAATLLAVRMNVGLRALSALPEGELAGRRSGRSDEVLVAERL